MKDKESPKPSAWKRAISRSHAFMYRKFPSLVPRPNLKELLAGIRRTDHEANRNSEPPAEEEVSLQCLWAVEYYSPSHIPGLLGNLAALGWNDSNGAGVNKSPGLWIQEQREAPITGGWMNLGIIRSPMDTKISEFGAHSDLPKGIEYATASMFSLTSSVSCIVVGFVLDDISKKKLEQALRLRRTTDVKAIADRGQAIVNPTSQKARDISKIRTELRHMASQWFRSNLPGLFADGERSNTHPTCEFLTLRTAVPFPDKNTDLDSNKVWLNVLGLYHSDSAWTCRGIHGLKFARLLYEETTGEPHAILVARQDALLSDQRDQFGGESRGSMVDWVDSIAISLVSRWGVVCMLNDHQRYLNRFRDQMMRSRPYKQTPHEVLEYACNRLARGVDISSMVTELRNDSSGSSIFWGDFEEFLSDSTLFGEKENSTLSVELMRQIQSRAERIRHEDKASRSIVNQYLITLESKRHLV